jgi:hypothetical protein
MIDSDSCVSARSEVASCGLADGAALMDLRTGTYFSLNSVASFIWGEIETPLSVAAVCERVTEKFDLGSSDCGSDVRVLLTELATLGLVDVEPIR